MGKFGKWIGAGLGFVLGGGPIGALIGLSLGWMFDSASESIPEQGTRTNKATTGDFVVSLLVLIAAVMKADGKIVRSELDYVKAFLIQRFGKDSAGEALRMLRDLLKQDIPLVLGLLAEQLREPAFNKEDLRTLKKRIIQRCNFLVPTSTTSILNLRRS